MTPYIIYLFIYFKEQIILLNICQLVGGQRLITHSISIVILIDSRDDIGPLMIIDWLPI